MEIEKYITRSEEETIDLGEKFAERLLPGDTVAFFGDLGAGKTEFIKGICKALGVTELVTSPTFTIMNQYFGLIKDHEIKIYHIDLYRIKDIKELEDIGFQDCIYSDDTIKFIEWSEKAGEKLDNINYKVKIEIDDDTENDRIISLEKLKAFATN